MLEIANIFKLTRWEPAQWPIGILTWKNCGKSEKSRKKVFRKFPEPSITAGAEMIQTREGGKEVTDPQFYAFFLFFFSGQTFSIQLLNFFINFKVFKEFCSFYPIFFRLICFRIFVVFFW